MLVKQKRKCWICQYYKTKWIPQTLKNGDTLVICLQCHKGMPC